MNFGSSVFNGRSRVQRMNLAEDHAEDRRETVAKIRAAREERERNVARRRAALLISRNLKCFVAQQRLQRLVEERIRSLLALPSALEASSSAMSLFRLMMLLRRNTQTRLELLRSTVEQLAAALTTVSAPFLREVAQEPCAVSAMQRGLEASFAAAAGVVLHLASASMQPSGSAEAESETASDSHHLAGGGWLSSLLTIVGHPSRDTVLAPSLQQRCVELLVACVQEQQQQQQIVTAPRSTAAVVPRSVLQSLLVLPPPLQVGASSSNPQQEQQQQQQSLTASVIYLIVGLPTTADSATTTATTTATTINERKKGVSAAEEEEKDNQQETAAVALPLNQQWILEAAEAALEMLQEAPRGVGGGSRTTIPISTTSSAARTKNTATAPPATTGVQDVTVCLRVVQKLQQLTLRWTSWANDTKASSRILQSLRLSMERLFTLLLEGPLTAPVASKAERQVADAVPTLSGCLNLTHGQVFRSYLPLVQLLTSVLAQHFSVMSRAAVEDAAWLLIAPLVTHTSSRLLLVPFLAQCTAHLAPFARTFLTERKADWLANASGSGMVEVTMPSCVSLALHVISYFLDSRNLDDVLQLPKRNAESEDEADGQATPIRGEDLCRMVTTLKTVVVQAHLAGCVAPSSEIVVHRMCVALTKLHTCDEIFSFAKHSDWIGSGVTVSLQNLSMALWDQVSDQVDGATSASGDAEEQLSSAAAASGAEASALVDLLVQVAQALPHADTTVDEGVPLRGSRSWSKIQRFVRLVKNVPFTVPFPLRVQVFGLFVQELQAQEYARWDDEVVVRRGRVFEDAFLKIHRMPSRTLRSNFRIRFESEEGGLEAGFGHGVFRDFIVSFCKDAFAPEIGLFTQTAKSETYPNPLSYEATQDSMHLARLQFIGSIVGKAVVAGVLLGVPFARPFCNALLGRRNSLYHLADVDPELHRSLMILKHMSPDEIDAMGLTFSVSVDAFGEQRDVDLIPNGRNVPVTAASVHRYALFYADYKLNRSNAAQVQAFFAGLTEIVPPSLLRLFDSNELRYVFQGADDDVGIDVEDWKANTEYSPPDAEKSLTVRHFWTVVEGMSMAERRSVLRFATAVDRAPLLGFRHMSPRFTLCITSTPTTYLPSAATCFCQLKLPAYQTVAEMKEKLTTATEHGTTFQLS